MYANTTLDTPQSRGSDPDFGAVPIVPLMVHKKNPLGDKYQGLARFFQGNDYYSQLLNKAGETYNKAVRLMAERSQWKLGSLIVSGVATAAAAFTGFWVVAIAAFLVGGTAYKAADIGALKLRAQHDNAIEEIGTLGNIAIKLQEDACRVEPQGNLQHGADAAQQELGRQIPNPVLRESNQPFDAAYSVQDELSNQEFPEGVLELIASAKGREA